MGGRVLLAYVNEEKLKRGISPLFRHRIGTHDGFFHERSKSNRFAEVMQKDLLWL
jgi:hypothetical protein